MPLGDSEVVFTQDGESLPGDCSPKSDTTLKRSLSLCQDDKMPTYSTDDDTAAPENVDDITAPDDITTADEITTADDITKPLDEPSHATPTTPAIPVSKSFDSSESEAVGSPVRNILKEQQVEIVEKNPEGVIIVEDNHSTNEKQKISVGHKFQHYTRVPQLRKYVSNRVTWISSDYMIVFIL